MDVIGLKKLHDFWRRHRDAENALKAWHAEVVHAQWESPADVKARYPKASILKGSRVVFNICGNKYRLVVQINYELKKVLIRFIGTHADYDKIDAETI